MICLLLGLSLGTAIASAADTTAGEENNNTVSVSKDNTISSVPVIYVAIDGSGDYNCDGIADQVEINEALQYAKNNNFDTVYIKSGTYTIDDSIRVPDGMTLTGDSDATVELVKGWRVTRSDMLTPMITGATTASSDITISGFTINGNRYDQNAIIAMKEVDSFPAIQFFSSERITVKDMVIRDIAGDGVKIHGGKGHHKILNNTIHDTGHDDIFLKSENHVTIDGNTLSRVAADCGIRLDNCANTMVTNNSIQTDKNALYGCSGIYLLKHANQLESYNITIAYNTIYDTREMGIVLAIAKDANNLPTTYARDVHIYNNTIHGAGTNYRTGYPYGGGIWLDGWSNVIIENNVIDGSMGDGIAYGQRFANTQSATYTTIVRNNIITNTVDSPVLNNDGFGINNRLGSNYKFVLENNVIWNNINGNYNNVQSSDTDINEDPLFVDPSNHDFRLMSSMTNPLTEDGNPASDSINGSEPNGDSINVDQYSNATEASKSASDKPSLVDDNRAPIITIFEPVEAAVLEEGSTVNISVGAVDAEGDELSYSITIDGTEVSTSTSYEWYLDYASAGSHVIEVTVSDGVNTVTSSHNVSVA
ncbi:right-handed parallel beta-helix repeat-containing protein [Methanolobus sp.]|uniref:right-handed parallel beta-helix repeat-containing protein n=1 Tax=Methanolobus sp. TaxID=1874737 RepID=UPI0025E997C5|nr:right-handed parallel beta-helix repeat-containing protein [Methanolobus sp.]